MHAAELVLWPFLEEAPFASAMFDLEMRYLHATRGWRKDYGLGQCELRGVCSRKFRSGGRACIGEPSLGNSSSAKKIALNAPMAPYSGCAGRFAPGTNLIRPSAALLFPPKTSPRAKELKNNAGKSITSVPKKTMDALMNWHWPGNVRELENFLERSVILTSGTVLAAPISELVQPHASPEKSDETSLVSIDRQHILKALKDSDGRISGPRGAAARLGLKRTTLQSKLKKLGIR